jgi:hypothetical protein
MPPHEDDVTRTLVRLVAELPDEDRLVFLREGLGVTAVPADGVVTTDSHPASPYENEGERIVLIGLGPRAEVAWPEGGKTSPGSIIDAVLGQFGRLTVLVEVKVRGTLDGWQLLRHAGAWDMPVPQARFDELPRGVGLVSWDQLAAWIDRRAPATESAAALRAKLAELGLDAGEPAPLERTPAVPRGEEPPIAPLREVLGSLSAAEVRGLVSRLYGTSSPLHVAGDAGATKRDARAVATRFEEAGEPVPGRLFDNGPGGIGDVITPGRALSMLVSAKPLARRHLIAPSWADVRDRLLFRGADRGVATAMWAFSEALSGPDQRRLGAHAGRLWTVAPPRSHATPVLSDALAEIGFELE